MRTRGLVAAMPWVLALAAAFAACGGGDDGTSVFDGGDGDSPPPDTAPPVYSDFPPTPIIDSPDGGPGAPANSSVLFGPDDGGATSGGPCLVEPEIGSIYPNNWLRPRFHWIAPGGENLFELRVHAANQVSDLVVYTASNRWTMPASMWTSLAAHSQDVAMSVLIRGGVYSSGSLSSIASGSSGPIGIAPVAAPGAIVYWTTSGGSALKGFSIGDETVGPVLTPAQVQQEGVGCIGCHTSTPDGLFAEMSTGNGWNNAIASVESGKTGQVPSFLGAAGKAALQHSPRGISTFSAGHWSAGDHVVVTMIDDSQIGWVDLEATTGTASGTFTRTGDTRGAGAPAWSHDGNTITYVSNNVNFTGRLDNGPADLYQIPYSNRAGGAAKALPGASDPSFEEYYPAYSPDDKLIAFDKIPNGHNMYNQPVAEVQVIASGGGTAVRLDANDPPACTSKKSPGVTNSWPKWSPLATTTSDGRTFYWIVFSSTRDETGNPQLYVSPVVVDKMGKTTTYHSLYLWNQPAAENNHTPAWDYFKIPPPPPPN